MTPLKILKLAVQCLNKADCKFCLVGGHAASLYRSQERLTRDVDFALVGSPLSQSVKIAEKVVKQIGLSPVVGFILHKTKRKNSISMISSKPAKNELKGLIDILLPELPWVVGAVERAQSNLIDLGFAKVPVITPEDLVVAKCYALQNSPDRFQDLDDIKEMFLYVEDLDSRYIKDNLKLHGLSIPKDLRRYFAKK